VSPPPVGPLEVTTGVKGIGLFPAALGGSVPHPAGSGLVVRFALLGLAAGGEWGSGYLLSCALGFESEVDFDLQAGQGGWGCVGSCW